ncbi:MAG: ABC transporter ATP-binding protein [Geminicoccaceae bacterium]|nr:ABC transporter ATP-binding protein [Geminicoccaceae bacterium]MCB9942021.1 ABC transporter ATP-binding protein [Geminicoccaceae bacterium]
MAGLRLVDVERHFGPVEALRGMSFDVLDGEFFCVLGPSSSGKTTTLRAIAGLEKLRGGRIVMDDRDITDAPVQGRDMAMIFQTFALYPHLTIRKNFSYPLQRDGMSSSEIRKRVGEIAELLRVTHTLDRKPPTLSGGEQQRVAIGRAIIRRPRLLLLDEPLTNLDAKLRHDMRAEFKRLHRELGMTMLYATPDQLEALTMGQRVAVIRDGRVVQIDTPKALYSDPGSTYVAGMVGAPAMNFVDGEIRGGGGGRPEVELPFARLDAGELPADGGRSVTVGIRPHDIALGHGDGAPGTVALDARIHLTEPLGDVTILDLDVPPGCGLRMVLREEAAAGLDAGQNIPISFSVSDIHLFGRDTGARLV